jgi:hypothetical protein
MEDSMNPQLKSSIKKNNAQGKIFEQYITEQKNFWK